MSLFVSMLLLDVFLHGHQLPDAGLKPSPSLPSPELDPQG
jgi:hypothetical protein